jgi:hypothetical protein
MNDNEANRLHGLHHDLDAALAKLSALEQALDLQFYTTETERARIENAVRAQALLVQDLCQSF